MTPTEQEIIEEERRKLTRVEEKNTRTKQDVIEWKRLCRDVGVTENLINCLEEQASGGRLLGLLKTAHGETHTARKHRD